MENRPPQQETPRRPPTPVRKTNGSGGPPTPPWLWLIVIGLLALIFWHFVPKPEQEVTFHPWFTKEVDTGNIKSITFQGTEIRGELVQDDNYSPPSGSTILVRKFYTSVPSEDMIKPIVDTLTKKDAEAKAKGEKEGVKITSIPPNQAGGLAWIMLLLPTVFVLGLIWLMMRRARDQFDGGILGSFVKSPAKRHDKSKQRTTFDEVAGLENAKAELQEIVEFLKTPEKFQRLGGRIPKGVLLVGPPGSGKTLLARAVAGEAGVPFYSISGSEFIQMFVGVGASRVRDMFKTAKDNSPCILFIDEIDAVGRVRGAGLGGGHDEREQTLNQILTEMDGFAPSESVIVLAATNRPDVLDPALLRPGRFDRHVTVDRPTKRGRLEILKVHSRNVPLAADVDLEKISRSTVGMSGADLANLVNEAALLATRENKSAVDSRDLDAALDKVILGAKREDVITAKDKRVTAFHEAGHALVGWMTPKSDPVHKVTIIPRGRALGVTQYLPEEDRFNYNRSQILAKLDSIMGGRSAGVRRAQRRRSGGPQAGDPAGPLDGDPVRHERTRRSGLLPGVRGASFPRPGNVRAAGPFGAHGPGDRRGGGADPPRLRRSGLSAPREAPRRSRTDRRGPHRTRGADRGRTRGTRWQARDRRGVCRRIPCQQGCDCRVDRRPVLRARPAPTI
jgi:cell division protease FtsH